MLRCNLSFSLIGYSGIIKDMNIFSILGATYRLSSYNNVWVLLPCSMCNAVHLTLLIFFVLRVMHIISVDSLYVMFIPPVMADS